MDATAQPELPAGYTLREATVADASGIASVFAAAYPPETAYPYADVDTAREELLAKDKFVTFAIETNGEIAATASIKFGSVYEHNAEICKLAVKPAHQGNGLARALLQHRLQYLDKIDHDGPVFSAAVTEHPRSQQNLAARGFVPVSFHKGIQAPFFGDQPESQAIVLHEDSIPDADRPVYVPPSLQSAAKWVFSTLETEQFGREIVTLDAEFPDPSTVTTTDRTVERSSMGIWLDTIPAIEQAVNEDGPHIMVSVNANDPAATDLYAAVYEWGFLPVGIIPNWYTADGENRDAVVFQYPSGEGPIDIEIIDSMKTLFDHLDYPYSVTADHEDYWELTV